MQSVGESNNQEGGGRIKGILETSRVLFSTPSDFALKSLFYYSHIGEEFCLRRVYSINRRNFDSFLLLYVLEGVMRIQSGGRVQYAREGELALVDCYAPHAYRAETDIHFYYIHFDGLSSRSYYDLITGKRGFVFSFAETSVNERLKIYFQDLIKIAESPIRNEHRASVKIHTLLSAVASRGDESGSPQGEALRKAAVFMERHLDESITLTDIAGHVCLDVCYFSNLFKRVMGITPHAYLNNRRMEYAKELLWTTELSVEAVALKCGFEHATSFYRTFKRLTGTSPGIFRNL